MNRALRPLVVLLLALPLGAGCVENAVLEMEIDLPELQAGGGAACSTTEDCGSPGLACVEGTCTPRAFVLVQPRNAADNPFDDDWAGNDLETVELVDGTRTSDMISVVTTELEADLGVKVRFCATRTCNGLADAVNRPAGGPATGAPERLFLLEHPFYVGSRTSWMVSIPSIPAVPDPTPTLVPRCEIRGCVDGDLSMYCRVDGRHLCE